MHTHITIQPDGTYSLCFPWKDSHPPLQVPILYALGVPGHWHSKKTGLLKMYGGIIEKREKRGFLEKVDVTSSLTNVHYIPHHPVRKESATTPIRIVYDCSCKQSPNAPSLNDCLDSGPPFLNDLCATLLHFHQHGFAFSADIEKAFLHVYLDEANRDSTLFLWLSDHTDEHSSFITYRFRVVLFVATIVPLSC